MRIGLIGCSRSIRVSPADSLEDVDAKVGRNTGNLLFQFACGRLVGGEVFEIGINSSWDVNEIRERCDVIVFPSSNFINEESDFSKFADFLEALNLPVVAIGLGAQAKDSASLKLNLKEGTRRLVHLLADSSPVLGVRGEFSRDVLEAMGIKNVEIIGCPTNLIGGEEVMKSSFSEKLQRSVRYLTANSHHPWDNAGDNQKFESRVFQMAIDYDGDYLAQSHLPLMAMASKGRFLDAEKFASECEGLRQHLDLSISEDEFRKFVERHFYYEIDVPAWIHRSSLYDLSVGFRLHGNMVSFQSGTPSLWVAHDSRTNELCETMKLPTMSGKKFLKASLEEIQESIEGCLPQYFERRTALGRVFESFMKSNGLAFDSSKLTSGLY